MKTNAPPADVYARITDAIVAALEAGTRPWLRPWEASAPTGAHRPLRSNGQPYRGINVLMLWTSAAAQGFSNPYWMTFKQAQEFGGSVKRGEKGTFICYSSRFTKTEVADDGTETERDIPFLKGYTVFNVEQCDGLPPRFTELPKKVERPNISRIDAADAFFTATGATVLYGGDRAFYSPSADYIQMPRFEDFHSADSYCATLAHELVHWTKHESRLNRSFGAARFGNEAYAVEELVAEIGAAFVCASLDIASEVMPQHAAYVDSWLKVLKGDKKFIFTAASAAQKAADFLCAFSATGEEEGV